MERYNGTLQLNVMTSHDLPYSHKLQLNVTIERYAESLVT